MLYYPLSNILILNCIYFCISSHLYHCSQSHMPTLRLQLEFSVCTALNCKKPRLPIISSVTQLCPTLCDPMDSSTPGLPVHHQVLELTQTPVHRVGDAIQPSHPLSSPFPLAFNLSQHQGLFQWVSSLHQVAKVLEFRLQYQSFQWIFRTDFL